MVPQETLCGCCNNSCYGDVVTAQGRVYHQYCFSCIKCKKDLLKNGYFVVDGEFYCNDDYHEFHGTQCDSCGKYLEGEVINALEFFYHPECFVCQKCRKIFPPGAQIAYDGDNFICEECNSTLQSSQLPRRKELPKYGDVQRRNQEEQKIQQQKKEVEPNKFAKYQPSGHQLASGWSTPPKSKHDDSSDSKHSDTSVSNCAGCGNDIKSGQALLALEKQWHLWCFTCHKCGCLLAGEYMGRDGVPYCEQDYQTEFGVSCAGCGGYITGKVLQAGEKHYHPQCSRCAMCRQMFGEGEEMYLQGSEIWHPQCSEEFQREMEDADNKWLNQNDFPFISAKEEEEPIDTSSPKNSVRHTGEKEAQQKSFYNHEDQNNNTALANGYNDHARHRRTSSESSTDRKDHIMQPPSYSVATSSKPSGFRSIKPPSISASAKPTETGVEKPNSREESDEEDAPPKPPPPTRSSSNIFREKYSSGVYTPTPFNKPASQTPKTRPLSYIESAARKASTEKSSSVNATSTHRTTISISTRSTNSTTSADDKIDSDQMLPTEKTYQKGAGYNKLLARKSFNDKQKQNGGGTSPDIDPALRQKIKEDAYLDDHEFYQVFKMPREKFFALPKWKQDDLKQNALVF